MKHILLIATGGTIASTESGEGLAPSINANELLANIPEIKSLCALTGISIMSIDSTNMNPTRMIHIANAISDNYSHYDGFVITHGTDTMAYSAAALSYMLQGLNKPVVLTGSQIALEAPNTDAKRNLADAIRFACEEIRGVYIAFNGIIINGTHAMKIKTRSFDGFASMNFPEIAQIKGTDIIRNQELIDKGYFKKYAISHTDCFHPTPTLCEDVFIVKLFPGIQPQIFDFIKQNYKGVIIESFGIGGIPNEPYNIAGKIGELIASGIAVVITTQCLYEGIDLGVYAVGQNMAKEHVILGADMTAEALTMKLMWALHAFDSIKDIKKYMETPYFSDRSY